MKNNEALVDVQFTLCTFMAVMCLFAFGSLPARADITTGLVAYYPFTGNANDSSGNGHHGTVVGAVLTNDRSGTVSAAYAFDGNDYIDIGASRDLKPTNVVTVAAWVYQDDWAAVNAQREAASTAQFGGWALGLGTGQRIIGWVRRNEAYAQPQAITAGLSSGWHHLAVVHDGRSTRLFVDGSLKSTVDAGATYPIQYSYPDNNAFIGADAHTGTSPEGEYFVGMIDEVRVYSRALTLSDIRELHGGSAYEYLVAHYALDGNTLDSSANALHGANHGAIVATDALRRPNHAYSFDGVSNYIDLGSRDLLHPTDGLTAIVWANMPGWANLTTGRSLISTTQNGGWAIAVGASSGVCGFVRAGGAYVCPSYPVSQLSAGWHQFALTYDGWNARLYVDGICRTSVTVQVNFPVEYSFRNNAMLGAEPFEGTTPESGQFFPGDMDDVWVYNYALSPSEIIAAFGPLCAPHITAIKASATNVSLAWTANPAATAHCVRATGTLAADPASWGYASIALGTNEWSGELSSSVTQQFYRVDALLP